MSRVCVIAGCAVLVFGAGPAPHSATRLGGPAPPAGTGVGYSAPLGGQVTVVRAFAPAPGPYAAGHRGVDLASSPDEPVLAAGPGRVRFAGFVSGRGVVVIEHGDGVLTEYEPVIAVVSAGGQVRRGGPIGRVHGTHGGCDPGQCLHWGARRDGTYFDPMTLLVGLGPVRLLPWRG